MHVADVFTISAQRIGDVGFLNVHVEQVGKDDDVVRVERAEEFHGVLGAVEEIALVAVERFVNQWHARRLGVFTQFVQCIAQKIVRLFLTHLTFKTALHGADDGGRTELRSGVDDSPDEIFCVVARGGVRLAEMPFVDDPTATCAHGGDFQIVLRGERAEFVDGNGIGVGREHLDGIIAQLSGFSAAGGKVVPENERPAFSFFDE